jgi:hypothetical protein
MQAFSDPPGVPEVDADAEKCSPLRFRRVSAKASASLETLRVSSA